MDEEQNKKDTNESELERKANEYLDSWKRAQSDLANYKKDEERRVTELLKFGNASIVLEVINILDSIESALTHVPKDSTSKEWITGVQQIAKNIQGMLSRHGIERIKTNGEFDPNIHEAVQTIDDEKVKSNEIIKEQRSGYTLHGRVIRPAQVIVKK